MGVDETLFPGLARKKTSFMISSDLKEAGIKWETKDGIADFHALRHTYITRLATSDTPISVVKDLARHCDIRMTSKYTHVGLDDQAKAVNQLPKIEFPKPAASETTSGECLHMSALTAAQRGKMGHLVSPAGTNHE